MALWGRSDAVVITGNVSIANGSNSLEGLTGATFLTQLSIGDFVTSEGQEFKITAIADANSATVTPAAGPAIADKAATISDKPKFLTAEQAENVVNVSVAEAGYANNRADGIKTPGWTQYSEYTAGPGGAITRKRAEVLVAMKDPN